MQEILLLLLGLVIGFAASFLKRKGENQATKQDIGIITDKIESVKAKHSADLEKITAEIQREGIADDEKRNVYKEVTSAMLIFIQGGNTSQDRIEKFHFNYQYVWLWAPDEVVKPLSTFLRLLVAHSKNPDPKNQPKIKETYVSCLIAMRKDLGWEDTKLKFEDYEFVNIQTR